MARVALLGTGLLGSGMVRRFLAKGTPVVVWNRTAAKARALEADGAQVAATPEEAAAGADRVHFVLPDDEVVDALLDRIQASLKKDAVAIDHSTTLPEKTKARAERQRARGVRFLHAPVFMSPQMAQDGVGLMMVSGPAAIFDEVRPALASMTGEVWHLGERADLAAAYKLFGNCMLFAISAGLADIMAMARATGVDAVEALTLFTKFQPANVIAGRGPRMARGESLPASFTVEMARKDARLMIEAAKTQPLVALPCVAQRMDRLIATGAADRDLCAIGTPD